VSSKSGEKQQAANPVFAVFCRDKSLKLFINLIEFIDL
jgi:hypothetical protein